MEKYVCLLSTDDFLEGVLVLNYNLQQLNSTRSLLCLVSDTVGEKTKKELEFFNIEYRIVKELNYYSNGADHRWNHTFDKIHIFSLIDLDKIVYLDSDFLIVKNLDHLFDIDSFTMNSDIPYNMDSYNSSIIITKPNLNDYYGLINYMHECDNNGVKSIGDQNILNQYFKNINSLDSSYNLMRGFRPEKVDGIYSVNKVTMDVDDPKVFHYIGLPKPFMLDSPFIDQYSYLYDQYLNKVRDKEREFEESIK